MSAAVLVKAALCRRLHWQQLPGWKKSLSTLSVPQSLNLTSSTPLIFKSHLPSSQDLPRDSLLLYPAFFSLRSQNSILSAALKKLDSIYPPTPSQRKARKAVQPSPHENGQFYPSDCYTWEDSHFDSVITSYRESALTLNPNEIETEDNKEDMIFPPDEWERLKEIFPTEEENEVHLLHLSETGEIRPHVDNREAFGGWIVGVCLGGERVVKLEEEVSPMSEVEKEKESGQQKPTIFVRLRPGDVYVQKGKVRYNFEHSIPVEAQWPPNEHMGSEHMNTEIVGGTQRLSVMIREKKKKDNKSGGFISDIAMFAGMSTVFDML